MRVVTQPPGADHLCGQCCVATAAGVDLDTAIAAVGHERKRGTYARELARGLRALGLRPDGERLRRYGRRRGLPRRAIVAMTRWDGDIQLRHWMLWQNCALHDPDNRPARFYRCWRITSFLELQ